MLGAPLYPRAQPPPTAAYSQFPSKITALYNTESPYMDKLNPKIGERKPYHYRRRKEVRVENTKGKQPKGRNVGKLMQVMNLPVDVFLEVCIIKCLLPLRTLMQYLSHEQIASHLQPLDVLHLSRVSIELRETLMSRKMRSIWVAARNGMDPRMPECPEGLSEPRYASLVFETQCMVSRVL